MRLKTTEEKPPTRQVSSEAGKGLATGNLSKRETRSVSGRVLSERAAMQRTPRAASRSSRRQARIDRRRG